MATNLAIDEGLLRDALAVGGYKTKKATVTRALEEFIARRRQRDVLERFGTIEFEEDYDYKRQRKRK